MQHTGQNGLITGMTESDRAAVDALLAACSQHDGLNMRVEFPDAFPADRSDRDHVLYYVDEQLVGLAALDAQREVFGMVHPDHRRQGLGRALLGVLAATARQQGMTHFLVACDLASHAGQAFLAAMGGHVEFAEYTLELDPAAIDRSRPRPVDFTFQTAGPADVDVLTRLQAAAFDDPEEEVRARIQHGMDVLKRRYYLGMRAGEPIGVLRLGRYGASGDITAFGVLPAYHGRGYGRQMLLDSIDVLLAEHAQPIVIEVETENRSALGLYLSVGFHEIAGYSYYHFELDGL